MQVINPIIHDNDTASIIIGEKNSNHFTNDSWKHNGIHLVHACHLSIFELSSNKAQVMNPIIHDNDTASIIIGEKIVTISQMTVGNINGIHLEHAYPSFNIRNSDIIEEDSPHTQYKYMIYRTIGSWISYIMGRERRACINTLTINSK